MGLRRYRLMILALPLLIIPAWEYHRLAEQVKGYSREVGIVVDYVEIRPFTGYPRYRSVIAYVGVNGEQHRFTSNVEKRVPLSIGSEVEILVEPKNRRTAYVAGVGGYWFGFSIISPLAICFYVLATLVTLFSRNGSSAVKRSPISRKRRKAKTNLTLENGTVASPDSPKELGDLLDRIRVPDNEFAVVERTTGHYIQAAATSTGEFIIEYSEGHHKNRFVSKRKNISKAEMKDILEAYYFDDYRWKTALEWEIVEG